MYVYILLHRIQFLCTCEVCKQNIYFHKGRQNNSYSDCSFVYFFLLNYESETSRPSVDRSVGLSVKTS